MWKLFSPGGIYCVYVYHYAVLSLASWDDINSQKGKEMFRDVLCTNVNRWHNYSTILIPEKIEIDAVQETYSVFISYKCTHWYVCSPAKLFHTCSFIELPPQSRYLISSPQDALLLTAAPPAAITNTSPPLTGFASL